MIGSFWNLCRACPSMPVDKLHSEYRSTYRWHEYTGPRQEVVRRPPQTNAAPATGEIMNDICHTTKAREDDARNDLHKLEPAMPRRKKYPDLAYRHHEFMTSSNDKKPMVNGIAGNAGSRTRGRETSLLKKAISKLSTEYSLQFAWPQGRTSRKDAAGSSPRKSKSMGALKPSANAMVHRKRIDMENRDASELEPLVDEKSREEKTQNAKSEFNTEYKKKFRPFSQYEYSEGRFTKKGNINKDEVDDMGPNVSYPVYGEKGSDSWYREVVELRKKAGEYKSRGWASDFGNEKISDIYNKQVELWDQVSRRSSLSALSLASMTHKSFTKQEKDDDNNKKTSPTKAHRNAENSARLIRDIVRHHLERTTGGSDFDGLILSPTREKLEPTIPRKDDDSRGSTKNSPKKNSPLKSSSLKRPNQKSSKSPRNVRSQSVGPTDSSNEKKSPKKQSRSATVKEKKLTANDDSTRRPRPSSLNTTASSRSKSSSVPSKNEDERLAKANSKNSLESSRQKLGSKDVRKGFSGAEPAKTESNVEEKTEEVIEEKDTIITYEPVIKSPPEPTRVKSPEQILMKSPDPVNWTVPLDTGKTFTVTQNVREGDIGSRPHSEVKAWTPPDISIPVVQSAPPSLLDQDKEHGTS